MTVIANPMTPEGRTDAVRVFPVLATPEQHPASAGTVLYYAQCRAVQDAGWGIADAIVTLEASDDGRAWEVINRNRWPLSNGPAILASTANA